MVGGKPKNFLIEGEFHPRKPEAEDYISEFDLSAVADLNGDGKMEFVLWEIYYEGNRIAVFEMENGKPIQVLEAECSV